MVLARDGGPDRDDTDSDSQASYLSNGRGNRGVHKIVALDDSYVWATTGSSDVNRWKDVRPRSERESLYPIGSHVSKTAGTLQQVSSSLQKSKSQPPQTDHSQFSSATDSPTSGTSTPVRSKPSPLHQERVENPRAQLFGIPFDSLVCLSPPNDPYEVGVGSASVMSVNLSFKGGISSVGDSSQLPIPANSWRSPVPGRPSFDQRMSSGNAASPLSAISPSTSGHLRPSSIRSASIKFAPVGLESSSPREDWGMIHDRQSMDVGEPLLAIQDDDDDDLSEDGPAYEARLAYEDRDLAEDAQPLRKYPDETIKGSHGLIRSTMLNDRRHVLTIDTSGKVSLWDIIAGNCLGHFVQQEIQETIEELSKGELDREGNSNAARFTPGEVLELVKERIECEGSTQTWCSIDTRSGALSVHLEEQRIFDCEVYLDECSSIVGTDLMKEDQRGRSSRLRWRACCEPLLTSSFWFFVLSSSCSYSQRWKVGSSTASRWLCSNRATPSTGKISSWTTCYRKPSAQHQSKSSTSARDREPFNFWELCRATLTYSTASHSGRDNWIGFSS